MKNRLLLPALIFGLAVLMAGRAPAQTFTTLYDFTPRYPVPPLFMTMTNTDGANPYAGLTLSGTNLYGTASAGGNLGVGTLFRINKDGSGFTNLHSFIGSDGAYPYGGVTVSGGSLFVAMSTHGSSGNGRLIRMNSGGTGVAIMHNFSPYINSTNSDGAVPFDTMILSGGILYGTAYLGGLSGSGTIFALSTNASANTLFTNLHNFAAVSSSTNVGGANPYAGLALSGNVLYGTAVYGGSGGGGVVFAMNTDGTGYTNLYDFSTLDSGTNSDGANPRAGLLVSGNALYGTSSYGGSLGFGTAFKINTDGTGFTNLHNFTSGSDGARPQGGLILSGDTLYGTASQGGDTGDGGTVFSLSTDGTAFMTLHSFTNANEGATPMSGLVLSDNILYGTTLNGGVWGNGTVFSLSLPSPPQLTIISFGDNVVLTWPTNATEFSLQSAPEITAVFTNIPGTVNPYTNPIAGPQQFFRLSQ